VKHQDVLACLRSGGMRGGTMLKTMSIAQARQISDRVRRQGYVARQCGDVVHTDAPMHVIGSVAGLRPSRSQAGKIR
jgi:hypothetical protein